MKPGVGQQWQVLGVTASPSGASCYSCSLLFLPQLKAQTQEASPPALPFLEDAKAAEVGGFFRVDDDFVFPEDKPSAGFLRRMATPGHGQVGTCVASVETGGGTGTPMGSLQYDGRDSQCVFLKLEFLRL